MAMRTHTLTLGGYRHHVAEWRPSLEMRRTVVALHGFGSTAGYAFGALGPLLAREGVRVIAPDLLGFGQTERPDAGYALADYTARTLELEDALGARGAILLGHSFGGKLAAGAVAAHPGRYRALVLTNPGGFGPLEQLLSLVGGNPIARKMLDSDRTLDALTKRIPAAGLFRHPEARALARKITPHVAGLDLKKTGTLKKLRALNLPVEVVWGMGDPLLKDETRHAVVAALPGARLTEVPGAGHSPARTTAARVAEVILRHV